MKNKKIYLGLLVLVLLFSLVFYYLTSSKEQSQTRSQEENYRIGEPYENKKLGLTDRTYLLDYKEADVLGNQEKEKIFLVGEKNEKNSLGAENICLVIQVNKKEEQKIDLENLVGYGASLWAAGDFTGDGVNDILVKVETGGSGAIENNRIVSFQEGRAEVIFSDFENEGIKISGRYLDNFKAELDVENLDEKIELDLRANQKAYINDGFYSKDGKLLKKVYFSSYPFSSLRPDKNIVETGVFELVGYQALPGTCSADRISEIRSRWRYQDGKWQIKRIEYSTILKS